MHSAHDLLKALALVLGVAAVTTVVFQRLKQPVVLGYILAGMIVGPHVPVPLAADRETVETLSELGVILLLFSLGLEFSIRRLLRMGATAGIVAVIQSSFMVWIGYIAGRAFGWSQLESVFAGAIIAISSTTIIAKAFDEQGIKGGRRELVVGILIAEDLIGILLMAILTAVSNAGVSGGAIATSAGKLAAFLAGVLAAGLLIVPRLMRAIVRLDRPETTLVASIGICFGVALLAAAFGYSVALGAFLAGSLVAESGEVDRIEHLVAPVKDVFAAVFFVSVGLMFDPSTMARHWLPVAVFTVLVVAGKVVGVTTAAFFTGFGVRTSVQAGMSLAQIGEFSFIIAGLGLSLGATRDFLYAIAVAVSTVTTLTTPWMIRGGDRAARAVDRSLSPQIRTFTTLYGSWLEGLRARRPGDGTVRTRRLIGLLLLDCALLTAGLFGITAYWDRAGRALTAQVGLPGWLADTVLALGAALIAVPFALGVLRVARALGTAIAARALPTVTDEALDLAATPRRSLAMAMQLVIVLLVGMPVLAVIQPFVSRWLTAAVFLAGLVALGIVLHRTTGILHGHVRAGAQLVVEVLAKQADRGKVERPPEVPAHPGDELLADVRRQLPGIGEPVAVRIPPGSAAAGRTLAELDLRATGVSVLAIMRAGAGMTDPDENERLQAGDILALAGTSEAVVAARNVLTAGQSWADLQPGP